jgi:hypothetical protein
MRALIVDGLYIAAFSAGDGDGVVADLYSDGAARLDVFDWADLDCH